jgi:hypothetical protein
VQAARHPAQRRPNLRPGSHHRLRLQRPPRPRQPRLRARQCRPRCRRKRPRRPRRRRRGHRRLRRYRRRREWIERHHAGALPASTGRKLNRHIADHLADREAHRRHRLGSHRLATVRPSEVQAWMSDRAQVLPPGTLRLLVALLRSVYTAAVHDRLVASSPVARVSLPRSERQRIAPLTVAQAHARCGWSGRTARTKSRGWCRKRHDRGAHCRCRGWSRKRSQRPWRRINRRTTAR